MEVLASDHTLFELQYPEKNNNMQIRIVTTYFDTRMNNKNKVNLTRNVNRNKIIVPFYSVDIITNEELAPPPPPPDLP